jgi:adenine-specific DNA-methyltransferase
MDLFNGKKVFDYPKSVEFIKRLIRYGTYDGKGIVLDFFSGSATTAHSIIEINNEDNGSRHFIMVQVQEDLDIALKTSRTKETIQNAIDVCEKLNVPHTICEIGKERIRRAGKKIVDEAGLTAQNLDIGFRVLKCDSSNMKDVYYSPSEYTPSLFSSLTDNIKEDRTPEDLLFQVMLDLGVLLSSKIEETTVAGKKVFSVADGYLIACFDEDITDETIKEIAQKKPYYFVMRDGGYASDSVATNFDQIFAAYSPSTIRKVL